MFEKEKVIVPPDFIGSRLDRFIKKILPNLSMVQLQKYLRQKDIVVSGIKAKSNYILKENDFILYPLFLKTPILNKPIKESAFLNKMVVFENEELLVLNKPGGLAVQGGSRIKISLDSILKQSKKESFLVHRIDKETSGLLVVAKNLNTARFLIDTFQKRGPKKIYIAITLKSPQLKAKGFISKPLLKKQIGGQEKIVVDENGKEAFTYYEVLSQNEKYACLALSPITGRTHQLRVHLSSLNAPILGDEKYSGMKGPLFLHAYYLKICDKNKNKLDFFAKIPHYIESFLKNQNLSIQHLDCEKFLKMGEKWQP